jgi:cytosine/creatinine deaminase
VPRTEPRPFPHQISVAVPAFAQGFGVVSPELADDDERAQGGRRGLAEACHWSDATRIGGLTANAIRITQMSDEFMDAAISEAEQGLREGGIPIGSVLVHRGRILGRGHNRRVQRGSAVLHGEMDALENAGRQLATVYRECVLYTTLSPCSMCSGAILLYGIPKVIVGENQTFLGEEELLRSRGVLIEVIQDPTCIRLMTDFIRTKPQLWNEDIGNSEDPHG